MKTTELKSKLHRCINDLSDEQLLQSLYDFLQKRSADKAPMTERGGEEDSFREELYALSEASGNEVWANEEELWEDYYSKTKP